MPGPIWKGDALIEEAVTLQQPSREHVFSIEIGCRLGDATQEATFSLDNVSYELLLTEHQNSRIRSHYTPVAALEVVSHAL